MAPSGAACRASAGSECSLTGGDLIAEAARQGPDKDVDSAASAKAQGPLAPGTARGVRSQLVRLRGEPVVTQRAARVCVCVFVCVFVRERWWDVLFWVSSVVDVSPIDGRIPASLETATTVERVWRSLADYCRLAKLYCKQVALEGAPAHILCTQPEVPQLHR